MSTYRPLRDPWDHQVEAIRRRGNHEAFAYLMGMRTGKTKTLLDDFGYLEEEGEVDDLLIIAPSGVVSVWPEATADDLADPLFARTSVHVWNSSSRSKADRADREEFITNLDVTRILVVNVEALSRKGETRDFVKRFFENRWVMIAIDESTVIKGTSARTKFIVGTLARKAVQRRILTGLVSPHSPVDVYQQFKFLDAKILGCRDLNDFKSRYCLQLPEFFGDRQVMTVVGSRNLDDLNRRIEPYCYKVRLEDCYDVPEVEYIKRDVEMTAEQRKVYDELKQYAFAEISDQAFVSAAYVVALQTKLHQILCGRVVSDEGETFDLPENRTRELLSLLYDYDGKAIVWYAFTADIEKIRKALQEQYGPDSVATWWGGNRKTRDEGEQEFLHNDKCRFMISTAASGSRGRPWSVADLNVYYSNTDNLEHRRQSEERPRGVGKDAKITHVDLIVPESIDEKIIYRLKNKIELAGQVSGDELRRWVV